MTAKKKQSSSASVKDAIVTETTEAPVVVLVLPPAGDGPEFYNPNAGDGPEHPGPPRSL